MEDTQSMYNKQADGIDYIRSMLVTMRSDPANKAFVGFTEIDPK
jgi:hypothetical protein